MFPRRLWYVLAKPGKPGANRGAAQKPGGVIAGRSRPNRVWAGAGWPGAAAPTVGPLKIDAHYHTINASVHIQIYINIYIHIFTYIPLHGRRSGV